MTTPPFSPSGRASRLVAVALLLILASATLVGPLRATPTNPPPLYALVTLGETATQTLTLFNATAAPVTVTLYEANVPYAPLPVVTRTTGGDGEGGLSAAPTIPEGESANLLVFLESAADLGWSDSAPATTWAEQGQWVYDALTRHAAQTQAPLRRELAARGYAVDSFWIINALRVRGDNDLVTWLATQPEVARVTLDTPIPAPEVTLERNAGTPDIAAGSPVWGLTTINAPTVWAQWGVAGAGITVAALDSGADYRHSALAETYRGRNGATVSHDYNWFDAIDHTPTPFDPVGHGTHVLGTLAGRRGSDIPLVGVAPAARWIAARGCGEFFCQEGDILAAAQWLLAPTDSTGANPRPDLRPHIINNSWGFQGGAEWYAEFVAAWRAAGMFAPFAAGNGGNGCSSLNVPAAGAAFAVGATMRTGELADFSARGPAFDGRVKPELVAPGQGVYSAYRDGDFAHLSGTSMASPHVAGTVALLWSANPALIGDVATTEQLLLDAAHPIADTQCGPTPSATPNNGAGAGLLDAEAAVRQARVAVPWLAVPDQVVIPAQGTAALPVSFDGRRVAALGTYRARLAVEQGGTLHFHPVTMVVAGADGMVATGGRLVSNRTYAPIVGTVQVDGGPRLTTDAQGYFSTHLLPGSHRLSATASGYLPLTVTAPITEATYLPLTLTLDAPQAVLAPLPPLVAALDFAEATTVTATISNRGTQPLTLTPRVAAWEWQVSPLSYVPLFDMVAFPSLYLEDESVTPEAIELPFAMRLFGRDVTRLYVSSNGWASPLSDGNAHGTLRCLPTGFATPQMLAPFWADLDPQQGGAVRAGAVDANTFVISWVDMVAGNSITQPAPRYSFQLVLYADGRVEYRYGRMGTLPPQWVVGFATTSAQAQQLACEEEPMLLSYRRLQAVNQPSANLWLSLPPASVTVAPGETAQIPVTLQGTLFRPWYSRPVRGTIDLITNDLYTPHLFVNANAIIAPPPHELYIGDVRGAP